MIAILNWSMAEAEPVRSRGESQKILKESILRR